MKIAFDGTVLPGRKSGVGYYCEELLKSMVSADHETDFFVFSHRPVCLNDIGANGNVQWSEDRHFPIRAVYLHALLPGLLDRVRPDLCHYTNFLAPVFDDRPYVVTIHDMGLETLKGCHPLAKRLYTRNLIPRVARNARLILTNSEYSKREIVRHLGVAEDRIRVTPLAASAEFRPTPPVKTDRPYFLYVGNLEPRKNVERLLQAFAMLTHLDHDLRIVGNDWYRAGAIHAKAKALGIEDRTRFHGYVPRHELPGLYSGAAAFVYPSFLEGFGMPVVEAMACGTPVLTSNNSSLMEIAGDAALLVDPLDVHAIARGMEQFAVEPRVSAEFRERGLKRSAEFSWKATARLTLDAYGEAVGVPVRIRRVEPADSEIAQAIRKAVAYAASFDYPLKPDEIHERLFDVRSDRATLDRVLATEGLLRFGEFVCDDEAMAGRRALREAISDGAIDEAWPRLCTLASFPFVRMLAFSGSTAHRNMTEREDLDLFVVIENGKLWTTFLSAIIWAKWCGIRRNLCMNYLISDSVLPLLEDDPFTAQQMASLKPFYGKSCYDRFIDANPFVRRCFPNFDLGRHRQMYPELATPRVKRIVERLLKCGVVQIAEPLARLVLGWYLRRKAEIASAAGEGDVRIEPQRLKLHMHSHKKKALANFR